MVNRALMGQKSKQLEVCGPYTHKYGKIQGNEMVYGNDIIRRIDTFEFRLIQRFKSSKAAHLAYKEWLEENK
jgi:hypothetical protein